MTAIPETRRALILAILDGHHWLGHVETGTWGLCPVHLAGACP